MPNVSLRVELLSEFTAVELGLLECRHRVCIRPLHPRGTTIPGPRRRSQHRSALPRFGGRRTLLRKPDRGRGHRVPVDALVAQQRNGGSVLIAPG